MLAPLRRRLRRDLPPLLAALVVAAAIAGGYVALHRTAASAGGATTPPARGGGATAYDPRTGDLVMFGGAGAGGLLADTWLWDGSAWSEAAPATSPPARYDAQMAWDPQSGRVVLLGGVGGSGCEPYRGGAATEPGAVGACTQLQDAWAWDGQGWSQLDLGQGSDHLGGHSLAGAEMATDLGAGRIVLLTSGLAPESGSASGSTGSATATAVPGSVAVTGSGPTIVCPVMPASPGPWPSAGCGCGAAAAGGGSTGAEPACRCVPVAVPGASGTPSSASPAVAPSCPVCGPQNACPAPLPALTWAFDGSTFRLLSTSGGASPPLGGHLTWFPAAGRLADLGWVAVPAMGRPAIACIRGQPCPAFTPTVWEWDGSGWTSVGMPAGSAWLPGFTSPPVTDQATGSVVAVDAGGNTWTSTDPAQGWTQAHPARAPAPRVDASVGYDPATEQVVLFGGEPAGGLGALGTDTWTWDGTDWTPRGGTAPTPPASSPPGPPVPVNGSSAAPPPS